MLPDFAFLILRLTVGLLFAAHGAQKLFGWFGGGGMKGHTEMIHSLNIRPAPLWAWLSALAEFGGGLCLALGFFTPVAAAILISNMVMAIAKVHWPKGLWNTQGGYEYNLTLIAASFAVGVGGPGDPALDTWLLVNVPQLAAFPQWQVFVASLIICLLGVGLELLFGPRPPVAAQRPR